MYYFSIHLYHISSIFTYILTKFSHNNFKIPKPFQRLKSQMERASSHVASKSQKKKGHLYTLEKMMVIRIYWILILDFKHLPYIFDLLKLVLNTSYSHNERSSLAFCPILSITTILFLWQNEASGKFYFQKYYFWHYFITNNKILLLEFQQKECNMMKNDENMLYLDENQLLFNFLLHSILK